MVIVLDTGALLALEHNDVAMWRRLRFATQRKDTVIAPATVIAQAWRGGPRHAQLSKALAHTKLAVLGDDARTIGELCGRSSTRDICDAHVALVAGSIGDVLYTSDPDDMVRLLDALGHRRPAIVAV